MFQMKTEKKRPKWNRKKSWKIKLNGNIYECVSNRKHEAFKNIKKHVDKNPFYLNENENKIVLCEAFISWK